MFTDRLLGEFLAKLRDEGLYDRATVVVTGDHGPRGLGELFSDFPEEMSTVVPGVPLFIRGPDVAPQVSHVDYQHVDFLPTMLDILRMPPEDGLTGVSVFAPERPVRDKVFNFVDCLGEGGRCDEESILERVPYLYSEDEGQWLIADGFSCADRAHARCSG